MSNQPKAMNGICRGNTTLQRAAVLVQGSGDASDGITRELWTEPGACSRSTFHRPPSDTGAERAAASGGNESGTTEV
jgi:hypothetical protein